MSDEQERVEPPASEETPDQSPAESGSEPAPAEAAPAPAAEEPAGEKPETPAPAEAPSEGEPATEQKSPEGAAPAAPEAAAEPEPSPEGEPAAQEKPSEEPAPAPPEPAAPRPMNYDGLESGLAWFGFERFEPPEPVGYEAPAIEAQRPAKELSIQERRRIQGRFEARRKEVETQKTWYQKIPLGALSMVPVLVVLIVVAILYPPWSGGSALPSSKQPLDEALLEAKPLPNSEELLRQLGVQEASPSGPNGWGVLPGDVIAMPRTEVSAKLNFAVPKNASRLEVSCDVCVVDRDPDSWGASITVEQAVGITLQAHPSKKGKDYVAGRQAGTTLAGYQHEIKARMWDQVRVVIDDTLARYYFNGVELKATAPRPGALSRIDLTTYNTRLMIRNWQVKAAE